MAIDTVNVLDPVSEGLVSLYRGLGHLDSAIDGVVQYLDLQLIGGIIQVAAGLNEPVNDELLIEDRKLQGDAGKLGETGSRLPHGVFPLPVIPVNQLIAMNPVKGEDDHHDEIRNQERGVEGVPAIQMLEGLVCVMGPEIVLETVLRS
jgi:hypothetical protein